MSNRQQRMAHLAQLVGADTLDVMKVVAAGGLDPATDFRFENWAGVSFDGCDLSGFDFTGARLYGCTFDGAKIANARFDQAELGMVHDMTGPWRQENRHAPGRVSRVADLSQAADWEVYRKARHQLAFSPSDAHLPIGAIFADAPGLSPQLVVVPEGEFLMSSPPDEEGRQRDGREGPQRLVTIAEPFAIARFAVTFDEWDAARASGAKLPDAKDEGWPRGNRPVINVSHEDAEAYCRWLSERTGRAYRLPSEAEWEYACRAGTDTPFWWGSSISTGQANYDGNYTYGRGAKGEYRQRTVPVDSFEPNPWGLHQVHGNVWEWCADPWHESDRGAPEDGSPWLGGDKSPFVVRGGSWFNSPWILRSANRLRYRPDYRGSGLGFRVARTLTP